MKTELDSPLGQKTDYVARYSPELLFGVPRSKGRKSLGSTANLFHGADIWNAYEISWLNESGVPQVALGEFIFPHHSDNLVESKSFKLYLNSFNNEQFTSEKEVIATIRRDLSKCANAPVEIRFSAADISCAIEGMPGQNIDKLDISTNTYKPDKNLLACAQNASVVSEVLNSKLLKSNCLVTGQPDWAHVMVHYQGKAIDHEGLLKYIISYRNHQGFHEHCVESIFTDIMTKCSPEKLTVYARYTRRGGLDINPFRSNFESPPHNIRHAQQ